MCSAIVYRFCANIGRSYKYGNKDKNKQAEFSKYTEDRQVDKPAGV